MIYLLTGPRQSMKTKMKIMNKKIIVLLCLSISHCFASKQAPCDAQSVTSTAVVLSASASSSSSSSSCSSSAATPSPLASDEKSVKSVKTKAEWSVDFTDDREFMCELVAACDKKDPSDALALLKKSSSFIQSVCLVRSTLEIVSSSADPVIVLEFIRLIKEAGLIKKVLSAHVLMNMFNNDEKLPLAFLDELKEANKVKDVVDAWVLERIARNDSYKIARAYLYAAYNANIVKKVLTGSVMMYANYNKNSHIKTIFNVFYRTLESVEERIST